MRGYGKSGEVGLVESQGSIFGSRGYDLSFGLGGVTFQTQKFYVPSVDGHFRFSAAPSILYDADTTPHTTRRPIQERDVACVRVTHPKESKSEEGYMGKQQLSNRSTKPKCEGAQILQ